MGKQYYNYLYIYHMFIFHPFPRVGKHSLWMGKQYYIYSSIICLFTIYLHIIIKLNTNDIHHYSFFLNTTCWGQRQAERREKEDILTTLRREKEDILSREKKNILTTLLMLSSRSRTRSSSWPKLWPPWNLPFWILNSVFSSWILVLFVLFFRYIASL